MEEKITALKREITGNSQAFVSADSFLELLDILQGLAVGGQAGGRDLGDVKATVKAAKTLQGLKAALLKLVEALENG